MVFLVSAVLGGTVLVLQFLMTLIGIGGHALDVDVPQDIGHDFGGDFHGGDLHGDASGGAEHAPEHNTLGLFKILSFRTIVAALAFFGLAGLTAESADASTPMQLLVAAAAGVTAMVGVYWIMRGIYGLRAEGTVRIQHAVGRPGLVYLRVPGHGAGSGKVHVNLQNRTMEYLAVTTGPELPTGSNVLVTGVVDPSTLEVRQETST